MTNTQKYENCNIKEAIITSNNSSGDTVNLQKAVDCQYSEGILNDTISCDYLITNSGCNLFNLQVEILGKGNSFVFSSFNLKLL